MFTPPYEGAPNVTMDIEGCFISYNRNPSPEFDTIGKIIGHKNIGGEETAMQGPDGIWRILNGDFRKEYEQCKTESACLAFYEAHKHLRSDWSTD